MDQINDDILLMIIQYFTSDNYIDKFIGTLGNVNKHFLKISRNRQIWEKYYYLLFPLIQFKPYNVKHIGDCTYRRCMVGDNKYRNVLDKPYILNNNGYIMTRRWNGWITGGYDHYEIDYNTRVRCMNPDHYTDESLKIRPKRSKFKDMFKQSAKHYYVVNRTKYKWTKTKNYQLTRCKRKLSILLAEYDKLQLHKNECNDYDDKFIDDYKPKSKKTKTICMYK